MKNFDDFLAEFNKNHLDDLIKQTREIIKKEILDATRDKATLNFAELSPALAAGVTKVNTITCLKLLEEYHKWLHE